MERFRLLSIGWKCASIGVLLFASAPAWGGNSASGAPNVLGSPQQQSAPASSPSKDIGVFVFGKAGQSADQQLKDETDCYAAAKQQSGIDPKAPPPAAKTEEQKKAEQQAAAQNAPQAKGGRARGAARGAAGGAAIGAIADDEAGKGAAAGAVAGTMRGGIKQRQSNAAAQKQAAANVAAQQQKEEEQAKAAHAEGLDTFQRAFEACMDARNYSVK